MSFERWDPSGTDENLARVLPLMGDVHWDALAYVLDSGEESPLEANRDLEEWGATVPDYGCAHVTELGQRLLEEREP